MTSLAMNQRIDFNNPMASKPANLANSAVLRMLEEEEQRQRSGQPGRHSMGWRKTDPHIRRIDRFIDWPPKPVANNDQLNMNNTHKAGFFVPINAGLKRVAWPPPPEEDGQEAQQEAPVRQAAPVKLIQSPALSRLIPIEQEYAPPQSKVYSPTPIQPNANFSPLSPQVKPQSPQLKPLSPQPAFGTRSPLSPSTPTQTFPPPIPEALQKVPSQTSAFSRPAPKGFGPVAPPAPCVPLNPYVPPYQPSQTFSPVFVQSSSSPGFGPVAAAPTAGESPRGWAPVSSPTPIVAPIQNQFVEPPPATIALRPVAPVHQLPPPLITSQPATNSLKGGVNMRGDQKWPPQSVKEAVAAENDARVSLAKGPACRPRKVKKDYGSFFAQNALPHNYPGYRAPPGTQHFDDISGGSQY
ncbi:uncharacterized protein LOC143916818 isoform X2 [Arctopsyche grandis]|uniref:uncharacterized protein LOC143916818 isoform X2 n=1 Tax=Arctopsyche grandis TaxID=121162 RepID=UPI00406D8450